MSYIRLKNKSDKKIALVDCNSFYVSCERLFNPQIKNLPVVVLSNNDGCVISRSTEAKKIGIKMGEPYFKVKNLVNSHNVKVFSSNYALYGDISRRVMSILKQFSPRIEVYSIDEAFLDLKLIPNEGLTKFANELRSLILKWTGIPVSIGIANTKTLSKIANYLAKKEKIGVKNFISRTDNEINNFLKNFPIEDVWGVGRKISKLYQANKIKNAYALKISDNNWVKKNTNVLGLKTVMELREISCISFEDDHAPLRKNCCVSRSFGKKVLNYEALKESVVAHCLNAAEKIRYDCQVVKTVTVFIRNSPFDKNQNFFSKSKKIDLPMPTDDSIELVKVCVSSLKEIFLKGPHYQKAGVIFSGLSKKEKYSDILFIQNNQKQSQKLMKAIDVANFKFGKNIITIADTGFYNHWKMKRNHSSKIDTSNFDYLPIIQV